MPADPKRVRDVFLAAAELPAGDRAAYLSANAGDDAELRAAVERLLAAHEQPAPVLLRPAPGVPENQRLLPPAPRSRITPPDADVILSRPWSVQPAPKALDALLRIVVEPLSVKVVFVVR